MEAHGIYQVLLRLNKPCYITSLTERSLSPVPNRSIAWNTIIMVSIHGISLHPVKSVPVLLDPAIRLSTGLRCRSKSIHPLYRIPCNLYCTAREDSETLFAWIRGTREPIIFIRLGVINWGQETASRCTTWIPILMLSSRASGLSGQTMDNPWFPC